MSNSFFDNLGEFVTPYKRKYAVAVAISIISVVTELSAYALTGKLAGHIFGGGGLYDAMAPVAAIAGCKVATALLMNLSTQISHHAAYESLRDIRKAVVAKMMNAPLGYFEKNGSGRLKTLIVDRIEGIELTLAHLLPEMTANILIPGALVCIMLAVDWRLALCILGWILLGLAAFCGMLIGYDKKYSGQISAYKAMNQAIVEYVSGIEVIKTFNQTDKCAKKYESAVGYHADYSYKWSKDTQIFSSLCGAISPYSIFPLLTVGLVLWGGGNLGTSELFFFMIAALGIFRPILKAIGYFDQLAKMKTTSNEIREVLDCAMLKRAADGRIEPNTEGCAVEFSHVSFSYDDSEKTAVNDITLKVPHGTTLALTGPSGSGKSTIAKLLAGYFDVTAGEIKVYGKPFYEYTQDELNRLIAYVDQDVYLFDTTILENIRIGRPDASDSDVFDAAKKAGCDDFIRSLPDGYNTNVGSAGGRLSGGERQRIAIARAIMKDAPILILDEATASSDPENETLIQAALSRAAEGKTLIIVAHRLRTITSADQIAYIKNGKVEMIGSHEQLLLGCRDYADMWRISSLNQEEDN